MSFQINNWVASIAIALALSCSYMLDGPDDVQAEIDIQNQIASTAQALNQSRPVQLAQGDSNGR